ncbi:MAG: FAD-dependent monooxygenase [Acetobacteraceae bacterium]|nr:FAD-dependent monooxygenase [Acetobacteraceae bacterium]
MRADNIVIGGGPAGAAAACVLAGAGREVLVLERHAGAAHKVCGDFLSAGAIRSLAALGLDPASLGAEPIGALRLIHGARAAETRLPFSAFGLSRCTLDAALLRVAEARGATILRGRAARSLRGLEVEAEGVSHLRGAAVFLATGKHELRGARRSAPPGDLVGFKTYLRLAPAEHARLLSHVEIVLFQGGYAGLQPVDQGRATLCVLVSRARLNREDGWDGLLSALREESSHLGHRLAGAEPCLARPVAIAGVPFGFLHSGSRADVPGLFRLGDQAGVVPSLAGDGIATALLSGRLAACVHLSAKDAQAYHRTLRACLARPVGLAMAAHWACRTRAQPWVLRACQAAPPMMRLLASWTRVPA